MTSRRVTRSSTRQSPEDPASPSTPSTPSTITSNRSHDTRRKRKSISKTEEPSVSPEQPITKRSRKSKPSPSTSQPAIEQQAQAVRRRAREPADSDMSSEKPVMESGTADSTDPMDSPSRRKAARNKKKTASGQPSPRRQSEKKAEPSDSIKGKDGTTSNGESPDVQMGNTKVEEDEPTDQPMDEEAKEGEDGQESDPEHYDREEVDEDDMYEEGFGGHGGVSNAMRALSGMLSGIPSRLRDILVNLRNKEDLSIQMIALQDLSEILLMANEESLQGHFSTDAYVKELVPMLSEPDMYGSENPEVMLLACRCLANMMEALPGTAANVVYGGAVPILCSKLLEIQYIDLAEQALSTLEKVSVEYPTSIVREGGLSACLNFLDFFATNVQRTAVTTAANCCRNIPEDAFSTVRDVMPVLYNVLSSSDQKVVEQGCLCVARIVESFRHAPDKLEQLVSRDLLKAILQLLLPGTTNLVGPHIHTQFLRVLSIIARSSPRLSMEMFKMNITDTIYQILTGVSAPSDTDDAALKIDRVMLIQALIHRPREQVLETLNVICELLPGLPLDELFSIPNHGESINPAKLDADKVATNDTRIELLNDCKQELRRFALVILPTLTDTYTSTVNLNVRQKVVNAQLKMIVSLESDILKDALANVQFASYLASILSQQDHPTLVAAALQASELLLRRLPEIYRYHFHREGVISEIAKLSLKTRDLEKPVQIENKAEKSAKIERPAEVVGPAVVISDTPEEHEETPEAHVADNEGGEDNEDNEDDEQDDEEHDEEESDSESSEVERLVAGAHMNLDQWITQRAKTFIETHEKDSTGTLKADAEKVLLTIKGLVDELDSSNDLPSVFKQLAKYFTSNNSLTSISSFELSNSKVVEGLLTRLTLGDATTKAETRRAFLEVFMKREDDDSPFSVLVNKLQDLLSRSEHFQVNTVHHNAFDGNRSPASMLAKQLRLKLVADDTSEIPKPYRNIMVSIHAIATFKALDDYLRPRITLSDQPRSRREQGGHLSNALAAFAAAAGLSGSGIGGSPGTPPAAGRSGFSDEALLAAAAALANEEGRSGLPATPKSKKAQRKSSRAKKLPENGEGSAADLKNKSKKEARQEDVSSPIDQDEQLECMDEHQMSEQEESGEMDAVLEDLDQDMADTPDADPGAVDMKIAAGGRVTAHKEDGTRIATPVGTPQNTPATARTGATASGALASLIASSAAAPPRPMSYAAAVQSAPQDWHIEFSIGDRVISNDTTIYGAVHQQRPDQGESSRSVWSSVYQIKFRRVQGPAPLEGPLTPSPESSQTLTSLTSDVNKNQTTASILHLLGILHALNSNLDDVFAGDLEGKKPNHPVSLSQFVNTKLTAKLNRQLEEPLIVASSCLPAWSEELARFYPFLFPFETRFLFLQSTSFGYSRSMTRWQSAQANDSRQDSRRDEQRPFLGRLQRQKVRISRSRILESAVKVMELYGASPSMLEVEYFEEVGTGLGPTLEFYSSVSRQFAKRKYKLWRENESASDSEFVFSSQGLFPAPMDEAVAETENGKKGLSLFKTLGKFVARAMLDNRIIDISFNPTFFRTNEGEETVAPSLGAVKTVDQGLGNSLTLLRKFAIAKKAIDDREDITQAEKDKMAENIAVAKATVDELGLDFTLPGYPEIELIKDGENVPVTIHNVGDYINRVIDLTLGSGIQRQAEAFRSGFSQVFPYTALRAFTPDELVMLFGRVEEDWSLETLTDSIKADHGFNLDSRSVRNLLQVMSEFTTQERREFLQFVTGSPKLPIGGFKKLTPMFTVVCKPSEAGLTSDDYLPSVMTCVNYLKLPDYTSLDVLRMRLKVAVKEGQGAFHLS